MSWKIKIKTKLNTNFSKLLGYLTSFTNPYKGTKLIPKMVEVLTDSNLAKLL